MLDIDAEIKRVKEAIAKSESRYLKRDYIKYLKKLLRKKRKGETS